MTPVIAGMTTSLDGFVADAGGSVGAHYRDLAALQEVGARPSLRFRVQGR